MTEENSNDQELNQHLKIVETNRRIKEAVRISEGQTLTEMDRGSHYSAKILSVYNADVSVLPSNNEDADDIQIAFQMDVQLAKNGVDEPTIAKNGHASFVISETHLGVDAQLRFSAAEAAAMSVRGLLVHYVEQRSMDPVSQYLESQINNLFR